MTLTMKTGWIAALMCALGSPGCLWTSSGSSSSGDDDGSEDDGDVEEFAALASCRGNASDEEVAETIAITTAYSESLHEMVVCGGLAVSLCAAIVEGIIEAMQEREDDATPDAWSFDEGVYRTAGNGVQMEALFFYADDFEVGAAGEQVPYNLFLVDTYLVGAVLVLDVSSGETEIRYDEPGPLVELLGFGANPPNPLPVTFDDIDDIQDRLAALEFESIIVFDDEREQGTIRYHLATPRQSAGALLDGSALRFVLEEADGERAVLDQTLAVGDWNVTYTDGRALDGEVHFHVDGRHFPFAGVMSWSGTQYPDRSLSCP
jgi:hypothetical protein